MIGCEDALRKLTGTLHTGRFSVSGGNALALDREEALGYLGYAGQALDEDLARRFENLARRCEQELACSFAWKALAVSPGASHAPAAPGHAGEPASSSQASDGEAGPEAAMAFEGSAVRLPGQSIARHLAGALGAAFLVCTLGAKSEQELRRLQAVSAADALMYGTCASALVEAAANAVEALIVQAAAQEGLHTAWRFSPGYGDLPLSVQPALLDELQATKRLGVYATESHMLVPTKSVTAVVGLFSTPAGNDAVRAQCAECGLRASCMLRRNGRTCHGKQ